jgi:hypothetical protein
MRPNGEDIIAGAASRGSGFLWTSIENWRAVNDQHTRLGMGGLPVFTILTRFQMALVYLSS